MHAYPYVSLSIFVGLVRVRDKIRDRVPLSVPVGIISLSPVCVSGSAAAGSVVHSGGGTAISSWERSGALPHERVRGYELWYSFDLERGLLVCFVLSLWFLA